MNLNIYVKHKNFPRQNLLFRESVQVESVQVESGPDHLELKWAEVVSVMTAKISKVP